MKTTSIQHKILQFRKEKMLAGRSGDGLVYRVSKDEAIEVANFYFGFFDRIRPTLEEQAAFIDLEFAINMAKTGEFKLLHEFISSMGNLFGIEIHPDWQEYTNKNMYY